MKPWALLTKTRKLLKERTGRQQPAACPGVFSTLHQARFRPDVALYKLQPERRHLPCSPCSSWEPVSYFAAGIRFQDSQWHRSTCFNLSFPASLLSFSNSGRTFLRPPVFPEIFTAWSRAKITYCVSSVFIIWHYHLDQKPTQALGYFKRSFYNFLAYRTENIFNKCFC